MGSLTEGLNFDKPGPGKGKGKGGSGKGDKAESLTDPANRVKLVVVVICFVVAGVMLLWQYGVLDFGGGAAAPKRDPVKEQEFQKQADKAKKIMEDEEKEWQKLPPSQRPIKVGSD
ncbi:MAG: hypothetical protein IBJ18_08240 [Phycisphaerales bacterium]|nr:hypothetical protein [Phycisphaerales bacterium]